MFRIEVCVLFSSSGQLAGLDALDERRRLGLPDDSLLAKCQPISRWVTVDESFARLHFGRTEINARRYVRRDVLMPTDITSSDHNSFGFRDDISDQRVKDLFIGGVIKDDDEDDGESQDE